MRNQRTNDATRAQIDLAIKALVFVVVSILTVQATKYLLTGDSAEAQSRPFDRSDAYYKKFKRATRVPASPDVTATKSLGVELRLGIHD